jgi:N-acetylglucosamine kinase-like BadF-type ATPase
MKYFLGIDVGSSKTHALIADETGVCLGFGKATGGNHQVVGYAGLVAVLKESFEQACRMAGITADQIAGAGFGIAGYDFPSDHDPHLEAITALGLSCPKEVVNDGVNGLLAGASQYVGVNVTAGSSVNCRGRARDGREGRITGNGISFGEFGGGGEIVWKGLHMVNYAWIKRIPPTALTQIFLEATGAKNEMDLMEGLSNQTYQLSPIVAVKIMETALAGDHAAGQILHWAGEELGWLAVSVIRQIGMQNEEVEVVLSGSVFDVGALISDPMRRVILEHVPQAKLMRLDGPPVAGPLILSMQLAGFDPYPMRSKLIKTAKMLVE